MKLAALLAAIRRRSRTLPPPHVDPLQAIHERCHAAPETLENKTLMRIARAIEEGRGDFEDADIWALGLEALGLPDALIERRMSGRYIAASGSFPGIEPPLLSNRDGLRTTYSVEKLADRRVLLDLGGHQTIAEVTIVDPAQS